MRHNLSNAMLVDMAKFVSFRKFRARPPRPPLLDFINSGADPAMDDIIDLAARVGRALQAKGLLLATAESCTGGGVAQAITEIAGSSEWFDCGFIVYSSESKIELLDVPAALMAQHGNVSEEIAAAMAEGALANSNAHVTLSTTGIAGPGGAVPGKPVGTICFGWAIGDTTHTERLVFRGDRRSVREQTVAHALQGLLRFVEQH
jgi:nicotinamide-nucleotide amidase